MSELPLTNLEELGAVLRAAAKSAKVSVTALINGSGRVNTSLIALAGGGIINRDSNLAPVLRVFEYAGWETVARPKNGEYLTVSRDRALPLRVTADDGGPLEITVSSLDDLAVMINTMALANDRTASGLATEAGLKASSLISLATGQRDVPDVRFAGVWRLMEHAGFVLHARPKHRSRRAARQAELADHLPLR